MDGCGHLLAPFLARPLGQMTHNDPCHCLGQRAAGGRLNNKPPSAAETLYARWLFYSNFEALCATPLFAAWGVEKADPGRRTNDRVSRVS